MFTATAKSRRRTGFTLLEIVVAVAILGLMSLAIYRFVQSNIIALRLSSEATAADAAYGALRDLLTSQWQSLPSGSGALTGEPLKVNDLSRDEIRWVASAGPGLLTRYASGDFEVTMHLQPADKKSDRMDLGLLRKPKDDTSFTDVHESWVPLVPNVQTLEIHYFDFRLNTWVDRWSDTVTLPRLVKVTVGREANGVAWEAIIPLARTSL
jgi:prepilin-type N-terminal cleavage/methylation domain-containing protein